MNEETDTKKTSPRLPLASVWLFFVLVYCWSWSFWILAAVLGLGVNTTGGNTLKLIGLAGPMLGGIGFAYFTQSKEGFRQYLSRIVDPRRISPRWWLVVALFVPGILALSVLIDITSGGSTTLALIEKRLAPFLAAPSTIIPFVFGVFINGPFPEELGWRGYILDRLQEKWSALKSSLILGAIWAIWHTPLFFMTGSHHQTQGVWSPWFWLFMAGVMPTALIFTWVFNNTQRSTLAAILLHFIANLAYELANVSPGTNLYSFIIWIVAALVVVAFWGTDTLTRKVVAK
jgi:uncharacterized protein